MTRPRRSVPALVAALTFALSACGQATDTRGGSPTGTAATPFPTATAPDDSATPQEDATMKPDPQPRPGDLTLPIGPVPDSVRQRPEVRRAVEEHAEREGVPVEEVTVAGFAEVTWSDGSLGCPQPGMMYTQALVPGQQLVLSVDGRLASYHAANGKAFSYCANPVPPASVDS